MSNVVMLYGKKSSASKQIVSGGSGGETGQTNIENVTATVTTLSPGSQATANAILEENGLTLEFGIPGSISDYNQLSNKPQIEGVTLEGNKTFPNLNLDVISIDDIDILCQ